MSIGTRDVAKEEPVRNDDIVTIDALFFLMHLKETPNETFISQGRVLPLTSDGLNRLKEAGLVEVKDKGLDWFRITQKGRNYVERFALEIIVEKVCAKTPAEMAKIAELLRR